MDNQAKAEPFRWWEEEGDENDHLTALLTRLEIVSRRQVESLFAGSYRSAFLGRGMDFAEVRPYQPGDEIRWIDWNVSARMDDIYVKQFTEERERTVILVWDASASMELGSHWRSKRELGAEIGMILAMSALANQDRVGLLVFGDKVERFIDPQRGRQQIMRMIREILTFQPTTDPEKDTPSKETSEVSKEAPTHRTELETALQFLQRVAPRHSIVFLMSDFVTPLNIHAWQRLTRRCEVIPVVMRDPLESQLPSQETNPKSIFHSLPSWIMGGTLVLFLLWGLGQGGSWLWSSITAIALWLVGSLYMSSMSRNSIVGLVDLETQESIAVDLRQYQTDDGSFQLPLSPTLYEVQEAFLSLGLDSVNLQTEKDPADALRVFFRQRQRMSGRSGRVSSAG